MKSPKCPPPSSVKGRCRYKLPRGFPAAGTATWTQPNHHLEGFVGRWFMTVGLSSWYPFHCGKEVFIPTTYHNLTSLGNLKRKGQSTTKVLSSLSFFSLGNKKSARHKTSVEICRQGTEIEHAVGDSVSIAHSSEYTVPGRGAAVSCNRNSWENHAHDDQTFVREENQNRGKAKETWPSMNLHFLALISTYKYIELKTA